MVGLMVESLVYADLSSLDSYQMCMKMKRCPDVSTMQIYLPTDLIERKKVAVMRAKKVLSKILRSSLLLCQRSMKMIMILPQDLPHHQQNKVVHRVKTDSWNCYLPAFIWMFVFTC